MSSTENNNSQHKEEIKEHTTINEEKQIPAKPEKEESNVPAFEKEFTDRIKNQFGDDIQVAYIKETRTRLDVKKEKILDVAEFIRDNTPFDHAESVTGTDFPDDKEIEVTYHLGSYTDNRYSKQIMALSTRVPREDEPDPGNDSTKLASLRDIFYSVEFHEREIFEMFGVFFEGHPDNRRLLLPEDWADLPPLRKDFDTRGR